MEEGEPIVHTRGKKGESPSLAQLTATHPWATARHSEKTASMVPCLVEIS